MNKLIYYLAFFSFILLGIQLPHVFAAKLDMQVSNDSGKTVLSIRVNPEGKVLNVVEGQIDFVSDLNSLDIKVDTSDSGLSMWATPPAYSDPEKRISFVGGVPNGFSSETQVFKVILSAKEPGSVNIAFKNGAVYLNDGLGTKENLFDVSSQVQLSNVENSFINIRLFMLAGVIILLFVILFVFIKRRKNEN